MKKLGGKGKDKIQAALERLDRLTKDEVLSAVAQILGVVHGIADDRRVVMGGAPYFCDLSRVSGKTGITLTDTRALSLFPKQHQTRSTR